MIIFKALEYVFPIIDKNLELESLKILTDEEKEIFNSMGKYDRKHSLEVYKKILNTELVKDEMYKKLALLHDCGKENVGIIKRVLHKLHFKTTLSEHPNNGYKKLKNINNELAKLVKNHHNLNYGVKMSIFQKCDDAS